MVRIRPSPATPRLNRTGLKTAAAECTVGAAMAVAWGVSRRSRSSSCRRDLRTTLTRRVVLPSMPLFPR